MPYGLTAAQKAAFMARQGVVASLYQLTYASGTVERITDYAAGYMLSGDAYTFDRTLEDAGPGNNRTFVVRWKGRKSAFFDAASNQMGASLVARIAVRPDGSATWGVLHQFTGTSNEIVETDDYMQVSFVQRLYAVTNVNPFILSRHHQRIRDATDTSLDRIADPSRTDFGQNVSA